MYDVIDGRDLYYRIAAQIREMRSAENLSQEDLAGRAGLSRAQLANIESQRQRPPVDVIYRLAAAMNVDPRDLLPPVETLKPDRHVVLGHELPLKAAQFVSGLDKE